LGRFREKEKTYCTRSGKKGVDDVEERASEKEKVTKRKEVQLDVDVFCGFGGKRRGKRMPAVVGENPKRDSAANRQEGGGGVLADRRKRRETQQHQRPQSKEGGEKRCFLAALRKKEGRGGARLAGQGGRGGKRKRVGLHWRPGGGGGLQRGGRGTEGNEEGSKEMERRLSNERGEAAVNK